MSVASTDYSVPQPPDDTVSALRFSPAACPSSFLCAGSWDKGVRIWEIGASSVDPKAQQNHDGPVLDVCFSDDGTKIFSASADKSAKMWDLAANSFIQVAAHQEAVKTVNWIKNDKYSCLMTGSWDKKLNFWDCRQATPIASLQMPDKVYSVAVEYPMAMVSTANRHLIMYTLDPQPQEVKKFESSLKYMHRCIAIFRDKTTKEPAGFALGSIEGRVAIQCINPVKPKDNFTFKCHRTNGTSTSQQDIYPVNDLAFHPEFGTLVTVGSDGKWHYWDKDERTKLKSSDQHDMPITCCAIDPRGQLMAFATGYDWSKGHEFFDPNKKPTILMRQCHEEMKPNKK